MADGIPERAAWLDHPVKWETGQWREEVDRLGIRAIVLPEGQVEMLYSHGNGKAQITVGHPEIVSIDRESGQVYYKIVGFTRFTQPWNLGGVNLTNALQRTEEIL